MDYLKFKDKDIVVFYKDGAWFLQEISNPCNAQHTYIPIPTKSLGTMFVAYSTRTGIALDMVAPQLFHKTNKAAIAKFCEVHDIPYPSTFYIAHWYKYNNHKRSKFFTI